MSQVVMQRFRQFVHIVGLAILVATVISGAGCGFVNNQSARQNDGDPLHLGGRPGPQGTPTPQIIQVRMGSIPNDRIVSLSLTIPSLKATNSLPADIELLTPDPTPTPVTVEFTRSAMVTEPVSIANIYQDTYSALVFPAMTGQVVFFDNTGQLVSQPLNIDAQTVATSFVLGATNPLVLDLTLDLNQSFTINDPGANRRRSRTARPDSGGGSVTPNALVITTQAVAPDPAVGQPESGSIVFMAGSVTSVDTIGNTLTVQPTSGELFVLSYDGGTQFGNCTPAILAGMMVEIKAATQTNGTVLASEVDLIDNATSSSEFYGTLTGYAPEGIFYNLVVAGGEGVNASDALIGKSVTIDWNGASYSVNSNGLDLSGSPELVFDEVHVFPGQFVGVQGDSLVIPDPNCVPVNPLDPLDPCVIQAGAMQPGMFELNQQTLTGTVSGYSYNSGTQTGSFTLTVANNAAIVSLNPGLVSITVRQVPQTNLMNSPTFNDGDPVKIRGLVFVDPTYMNVNYQPSPTSPVAFIVVAGRISN
jgi:hypothetical protein